MEVTVIPYTYSNEQFAFLEPLVKALRETKPEERIYFPDIGCSREAEIVCENIMGGDQFNIPMGRLTIKNDRANLKMAYEVLVQLIKLPVKPGEPVAYGLRTTTRLTRGHAKKDARNINSDKRSCACVIRELVKNFGVGAPFRKMITLSKTKTISKETVPQINPIDELIMMKALQ
jgi:hypothetical protein